MNQQNLKLAINWLCDLHNPEMIEAPNYCKAYLGFNLISQKELDKITDLLNIILILGFNNSKIIRISNSGGEIIPIKMREH